MTHPITLGRQIALNEASHWIPLKGAIPILMQRLELTDEEAGEVLARGVNAGAIGMEPTDPSLGGWLVTPRAIEMLKERGLFDIERDINWRDGTLQSPSGGMWFAINIYWPDVERAARGKAWGPIIEGQAVEQRPKALTRSKPKQADVDAWMLAAFHKAWASGLVPPKRDEEAFPDCRAAIGATDVQMKAAMQKVPSAHKRGRGHRDR